MRKRILLLILSVLITLSSVEVNFVHAEDGSNTVNPIGVYQGHTYKLYSNCSSWQEAEAFCELMGGHLATITSAGENEYVFNFMKECGYTSAYFGASDSKQEGVWEWVTGEPFSYTNWKSGEPNQENTAEDYAMFYWKFTTGKWNDGDFGGSTNNGGKVYICEWETTDIGITLGDYVKMGTYYGEPILWRCVDVDENGPLMLSDKILCAKSYDACGENNGSSHDREYNSGYYRRKNGSNYWGDSNIRCWLNSNDSAGNVLWSCGNIPDEMHVPYNLYNNEAGFLTNFSKQEIGVIKSVSQKTLIYETDLEGSKISGNNAHTYNDRVSSVLQNYDDSYAEEFTDKIFLLGIKQLYRVYKNCEDLGENYYIGKPSEVCALNSESSLDAAGKWNYILRDARCDDYSKGYEVRNVKHDGKICSNYARNSSTKNGNYGIRPAFYIKDNTGFSGNGSKENPYVVYSQSDKFQVDIYRANYLINFDIGSIMEKEYFNFDTPSKTIVDTGKNNGLSTMIDAWNLVTGTVDTVDDPTKLEDYICEQKDVYEAILLDLLESSVDNDVLAIVNNDIVKNSKKIADTVISDMKSKYYYDNISDFKNICKLNDDSISAIEELVTDSFKEDYSKINKISKLSKVIGQTIEYATDLTDYCEKLSAFCNMLEISESMQVIIQEMYKQCPLDNPALKSALSELNYIFNASEDEFINKMVADFFGAAGINMGNYFFDKMWDNVKTKFMVANPEAYVLLAAYKTGKLMSNLAFNTDTIAEKYYKLAAVNEIENLLQNVYYRIKSIYSNNRNSKNAQNYNIMVDFMFKMLDADCEYSVKYLQETDATLVAKIKDVFGNNDIDDAVEYVEELQNHYNYYHEKANTDWILTLPENYPSIYAEYVSVLKGSLKKQKEYLVACPVNVYIYDKNGTLVGSVIDNVPYCEDDAELTIYVSGDKKTVYTYGEEYDIVYIGNDAGTMDITITEYDEMKSTARSVNFNNITLTDGLTYTSSENGTTLTENAYVLMDEAEECIEPDYDSLTAIETETHIAEITRGYFTDTMDISRQLNCGQNVEITAYVPEGYKFVSWTSDSGEDIFDDARNITTKITMPDYDVNITANIIKCPTLSIAELTENNLNFKAINCENITSGVVILAIYNEDGSLNCVKTEDFAEEINFNDLNLINGKAKVMLWDSLDSLIPLTKATEKIFFFETLETE